MLCLIISYIFSTDYGPALSHGIDSWAVQILQENKTDVVAIRCYVGRGGMR